MSINKDLLNTYETEVLMPNYDKFMKIKSAMTSLQELVSDYEKDFDGEEGPEHEEAEDSTKERSEGKDLDDGGQSFTPVLKNSLSTETKREGSKLNGRNKKEKMGLMVGMLRKKMSGIGV